MKPTLSYSLQSIVKDILINPNLKSMRFIENPNLKSMRFIENPNLKPLRFIENPNLKYKLHVVFQ